MTLRELLVLLKTIQPENTIYKIYHRNMTNIWLFFIKPEAVLVFVRVINLRQSGNVTKARHEIVVWPLSLSRTMRPC